MPKKSSPYYDISIVLVLATGRDIERIRISIDSLNNQNFRRDRAQLCFVSNGNTKESILEVKQLSLYHVDARWVPNKNNTYNACFGRNAAIPMIKGKLVFFMHDGATLIGKDYLTRLWDKSQYGKHGVATRKLLINGGDKPIDTISGWFAHQDAIPARYFKELKFDEIFDGGHGYDDLDLYQRALQAGCEFESADDLVSAKIRPTDPLSLKFSEGEYVDRNIRIYNERWHR